MTTPPEAREAEEKLKRWLELHQGETKLKKSIREADAALDRLAFEKYPALTTDEIKTLVVDDKWMPALTQSVQGELDRVSQTLTARIRQLAERYARPLPEIIAEVETIATRVEKHLKKMGMS